MAVIRWNPWSDLFNLHSQMDELFNSTLSGARTGSNGTEVGHLAVDIRQSDAAFTIEASVPGFKPDDVEVTLDEGVLTIRGERREEASSDAGRYVRRERGMTSVYRQISLPAEVRADEIAATFEDGVLTITVPRAEKAQPKRIPVRSGPGAGARVLEAPKS